MDYFHWELQGYSKNIIKETNHFLLSSKSDYFLGDMADEEYQTVEISFEIGRETTITHYKANISFAFDKLGSFAGVAMMIMTTFHILLQKKYENR